MNAEPLPRSKIRHPDVIEARERAHAAFDQLWKSGRMTRTAAYAWLCAVMKLSSREAHIGRMHPEQCDRLVRHVAEKIDSTQVAGTPGNISFGELRAAIPKMEPILKTELMRALLEDADYTIISAITANARYAVATRELAEARAEMTALRAEGFQQLDELRQRLREDAEKDAAERAELRRRTEILEAAVAELTAAVDQ